MSREHSIRLFFTAGLAVGFTFPAVAAQGESSVQSGVCEAPDSVGGVLWESVRAALESARTAADQGELDHTVRLHRKLLRVDARVLNESDSTAQNLKTLPVSTAHPDLLFESGFVSRGPNGEWSHFSPIPQTLLDERFLSDYCVWSSGDSDSPALQFAPRESVSRSGVVGIDGTIRFDSGTVDLASVEFGYVNDPSQIDDSLIGGAIYFVRAETDVWFMQAWRVRSPLTVEDRDSTGVGTRFIGLEELGATTLEVTDVANNIVWSDRSVAVLSGTVFDSLSASPLAGAVVAVSGTRHWATTDRTGEFFVAGKLEGRYDLVFGHPKLDSLGFVSPPVSVALASGDIRNVSLTVPSLPAILSERCGDQFPDGGRRTLIGVVKDAQSGRVVPGALVSVSRALIPEGLQDFANERVESTVRTDSLGMYSVCGVPVGQSIIVNAIMDNRATPFTPVRFGPRSVQFGDAPPLPLQYPVARFDLDLIAPEMHTATVSGIVVDAATGTGVDGVEVRIDGTLRTTRTDDQGVFELQRVPQGAVWLAFRKLGFRMLRIAASIEPGARLVLGADSLRLERADADAVTLDPIVVEAMGGVPTATGFEDRKNRGFGSFLTRAEFEDWNPSVPTDLLRRMRGIRVLPNPAYGVNGDTRRYQIASSRDVGQRISRIDLSRTDVAFGIENAAVTECPVLLFLDGVYLGDSRTTDVDNMIGMSALAAIEFYSPSQVPPQFALPGSTCGVAVFWSR